MSPLAQRRDDLERQRASAQWQLGGLAHEMAIRDHVRPDLLIRRAAALQAIDAELAAVRQLLHTGETGHAGACPECAAPHSSGAVFCWQCGQRLLESSS